MIKANQTVIMATAHATPGAALDIGAGNGESAAFLAKRGFGVLAVDINKESIKNIRKTAVHNNIKIKTKRIDIRKFNFKNKYNIILAIQSLIFMKKIEFKSMIKKIKQSLKIGGVVAISSFTIADKSYKKFSENRKPVGKNTYLSKSTGQYWNFLEKNELKKYFSDKKFKILYYKEFIKKDKPHDGTPYSHQHGIAEIIVKKK